MHKKVFKSIIIFIMTLVIGTPTVYSPEKIDAQTTGFEKPEFIELLDQLIEAETLYGLSGAQLAVYKDGQMVKNSAYGYTNNYYNVRDEHGNIILDQAKALPIAERNPVTTDTLFDLASNTKMYSTVYAMQKLISDGALVPHTNEPLTLDTLISDIFPEFLDEQNENGWKDGITVSDVLSHIAGFAPDPQYHNESYDEDDGIPNGKNDLYSQEKTLTFDMIMKTPLTTKPGTAWAYSDVDFILAGFIVEEISGKNLDDYMKINFYNPLGLDKMTFNPLRNGFSPNQTSSAELHGNTRDGRIIFNNGRTDIVTGEVHDEKAYYSMDGISGHAGLFGSAEQVAYLAQAMLTGGELNGVKLFNQETIDQFTEVSDVLTTQAVGGWRRRNAGTGASGWYSAFAPEGTIGHTGWTGTNTMIDFENNITLSLNTNRTNTPIQGPGANTFYTNNSNITSYGTVSELIYRALGLGTDGYGTAFSILEKMINAEIPQGPLSDQLTSKRNVIRSLIHVLEQRAVTEPESLDLLNSNRIQELILVLDSTLAADTNFLIPTKQLDEAISEAKIIDETVYTEASVEQLKDKVTEAEQLLDNKNYLQADVDSLTEEINHLVNNLELIVTTPDLTELELLIDEAKEKLGEQDLYTKESYSLLQTAISNAEDALETVETEADLESAILALNTAIEGLVLVEVPEVEVPEVEVPEEVPEEEVPEEEVPEEEVPEEEVPEVKDPEVDDSELEKPLPETGESNNASILGFILIGLGLSSFLIVKFKKREAHN